jgi:hypothetical protein
MNLETELVSMKDGRSLLTDREREILAGEADVSDNYRYKVQSVARQRVRGVVDDVDVLREHEPEIFDELQEIVCENNDL